MRCGRYILNVRAWHEKCSTNREWNILTSFPSPSIRCCLQPPQTIGTQEKVTFGLSVIHTGKKQLSCPSDHPKASQEDVEKSSKSGEDKWNYLPTIHSVTHSLFPSPYTAVLLNPRDKFIAQHSCPDSAIYCFKTEVRDDRSLHPGYFF